MATNAKGRAGRLSQSPGLTARDRAVARNEVAGAMSPTDRVRQVLDATPEQQVEIDRILSGRPAEVLDEGKGPLLLGMGAAAKLLGCSRTTLWRTIEAGRLEKVELLPGSFRIRRADLLAIARGKAPDHADHCTTSAAGGAA